MSWVELVKTLLKYLEDFLSLKFSVSSEGSSSAKDNPLFLTFFFFFFSFLVTWGRSSSYFRFKSFKRMANFLKKIILKGTLPSLKVQNVLRAKKTTLKPAYAIKIWVSAAFLMLYKMTEKNFQNSKISNNLGISSEFSQCVSR